MGSKSAKGQGEEMKTYARKFKILRLTQIFYSVKKDSILIKVFIFPQQGFFNG